MTDDEVKTEQTDWKAFFEKNNAYHILRAICFAHNTLDVAINQKGRIIHPGAFVSFAEQIERLSEHTNYLRMMCEKADLEAFYQKEKESEK